MVLLVRPCANLVTIPTKTPIPDNAINIVKIFEREVEGARSPYPIVAIVIIEKYMESMIDHFSITV